MTSAEPSELSAAAVRRPVGSLEFAAADAFPFLIDALGVAVLGLLVRSSVGVAWVFGVQLSLLSLFAVFLAYRLLDHADQIWFAGTRFTTTQRTFATALSLVVIVTGVVALATLASSAALRYQASTQFFQLLSALDIAWAVSTVMVAVYWLRGRRLAVLSGVAVAVVCVLVVRNYISEVGFGPNGGWRVRGAELFELVIVYDMVVAAIAIGLLVLAIRRKAAAGAASAS